MDSEILVTPDLNGLIVGIDWLEKQGQFVWNFRDGRIKFEDGNWIDLQKEEASTPLKSFSTYWRYTNKIIIIIIRRIHKVYVSEDTFIPPAGNVEANV